MSDWIALTALTEIPVLGARVVRLPEIDIAIFRASDDRVFAIKDQCPHKQGPLSQGIMHGTAVTCPLHNWQIDLNSGKAMGADEGCAHVFLTKVEKGIVFLQK